MPSKRDDEQGPDSGTEEPVGPFTRKKNYRPGELVPVAIPHELRAEIEAERDRVDPPVDGMGMRRMQRSLNVFVIALIREGLKRMREMPDYKDPFPT